jgi:hypothetical protein
VLFSRQFELPQDHPLERHRCRNVRCGAKLEPAATNPRDAFCCQGCFDSFYRGRCLVCERSFIRQSERQQLCKRRRCRDEFYRHKELFLGTRYLPSVLRHNASRNARKSRGILGALGARPFAQIVGPRLSPSSLRLASLPLDSELAARLERTHRPYFEALKKSKQAAARRALIKRGDPPVNVLGGYRFPNAPQICLSPLPASEWATPSSWTPTATSAVCPEIPDFLTRRDLGARRRQHEHRQHEQRPGSPSRRVGGGTTARKAKPAPLATEKAGFRNPSTNSRRFL